VESIGCLSRVPSHHIIIVIDSFIAIGTHGDPQSFWSVGKTASVPCIHKEKKAFSWLGRSAVVMKSSWDSRTVYTRKLAVWRGDDQRCITATTAMTIRQIITVSCWPLPRADDAVYINVYFRTNFESQKCNYFGTDGVYFFICWNQTVGSNISLIPTAYPSGSDAFFFTWGVLYSVVVKRVYDECA
jgi:hypothetical protein